MFRRKKESPATVPQEVSPLDRLVQDAVGYRGMEGKSPFNFVLREAILETALKDNPAWPPSQPVEAYEMYNDYVQLYDTGEFDELVSQVDLNTLVGDAGRLALGSPDNAIPPRRSLEVRFEKRFSTGLI